MKTTSRINKVYNRRLGSRVQAVAQLGEGQRTTYKVFQMKFMYDTPPPKKN